MLPKVYYLRKVYSVSLGRMVQQNVFMSDVRAKTVPLQENMPREWGCMIALPQAFTSA